MQQKGPVLPSVPAYVAFTLVIGSFMLGHYSQQAHNVQTALKGEAPEQVGIGRHLRRRELHIGGQDTKQTSQETAHTQQQLGSDGTTTTAAARRASQQQAHALIDPLNTPALEQFMLEKSGLLRVRPAITPALSGDPFLHVIPFQILSWAPRLIVFPAFVDPERCRIIMEYARAGVRKSGLAYRPGEKQDQEGQQTRTSSGMFLSSMAEPTGSLAWVEERIAAATMLPVSHGEPFNILKYENMQHYDSHMDSFDPKEYGAQSNQRVATVLVYLSDVEEGGETVFKREGRGNGSRVIKDWRSCDDGVGYKYYPRMGDAVLFYDTRLNGEIDPHALHGGCPIKAGEKWVMTKWLRAKPMNYDTAAELEIYGNKTNTKH